uniref:Uncharacterized protein n=1 Tax=viral metagenome TaxID=1070528 RepID=A0A6C0H7L3_9ZZZZ
MGNRSTKSQRIIYNPVIVIKSETTENKKIVLTSKQIIQIEKYIYDSYCQSSTNFPPFEFNKTYFNINFTFRITHSFLNNNNYKLLYLENKIFYKYKVLKHYNNVKQIFNDINNFENIFVYYNDEIIDKIEYEYQLKYKEIATKNANDVKEIIKNL